MPVVELAVGLTRVAVVSSKAEQTGGFGHGDTNVIVQRPPLAAPTVTRPTLSLPPIDGEVPQSLDPEPSAGAAPVVISCPNMPSAEALRGVIDTIRKFPPSNCRTRNS